MDKNSAGSIYLFVFLFATILLVNFSNYLNELTGISQTTLMITVTIIGAILFLGLIIYLDKFEWYRELTSREFKEYYKVYYSYRSQVIKRNKRYDIFVNDYCNGNLFIPVNIETNNNIDIEDLNKKNLIYNRIKDLLENRRDLVEKYFQKERFKHSDYLELKNDYEKTYPEQIDIELEITLQEKLEKVKAEILKYEFGEKQPKHIGQRLFGYLLKAGYFNAYNDSQRLEEWKKFTELETTPEMSYLRDPSYNKNSIDESKFSKQLKQIKEFFYLIGLDIEI